MNNRMTTADVPASTLGGRAAEMFHALTATRGTIAPAIARITLGLVIFPHGAQKMLGWFGGYGFDATMGFLTGSVGLPAVVALLVIISEFFGSLALLLGLFSRAAVVGIIAVMVGAVLTTHLPNGFFMNWSGQQAGEGFEYHLLVVGLALTILIQGSGRFSLDGLFSRESAPRN